MRSPCFAVELLPFLSHYLNNAEQRQYLIKRFRFFRYAGIEEIIDRERERERKRVAIREI